MATRVLRRDAAQSVVSTRSTGMISSGTTEPACRHDGATTSRARHLRVVRLPRFSVLPRLVPHQSARGDIPVWARVLAISGASTTAPDLLVAPYRGGGRGGQQVGRCRAAVTRPGSGGFRRAPGPLLLAAAAGL
jgi:hypothetical protein